MADFDLEDELLQVAGGGRSSGGGGFKNRRRSAAFSSSSSDDDDDDGGYAKSDGDDEGEERRGGGSDGGRVKGSRMPLKKRLDMADKDDEGGGGGRGDREDDDDGSESELSFGESLYKDEADREHLASMTELERELILMERAERRDSVLERRKLREAAQAREREAQSRRAGGVERSSARGADSSNRDIDRPLALRVRSTQERQRKSLLDSIEAYHANKGGGGGASSDISDVAAERKRRLQSMTAAVMGRAGGGGGKVSDSSSSSSSLSSSSSSEGRGGGNEQEGSDDEETEGRRKESGGGEASIEDLKQILVTRQQLEKWFMEPFFEEAMCGVLVRLGVGSHRGQNVYRVCEVVGIDARDRLKVYDFAGRKTFKYLDCKWGEARGRWAMYMVSNSPPTEKEFQHWFDELKRLGQKRLQKTVVMQRVEGLHNARKYVYTPDVVKGMLAEKRQMQGWRVRNAPAEKQRLKKLLDMAEQAGDEEEAAQVREQLKELENQIMKQGADAKALALAQINKKNQEENYRAALETTLVVDAKAGDQNYDPFSRRWTRSNNYIKTKGTDAAKELQKKKGEELAKKLTEEGKEGGEEDGEGGGAKEGENAVAVVAPAPLDGGAILLIAHDFDLPISLERIQAYGGPQGAAKAFMARKRMLETKFGVQVGQSDGRAHALTLTVHDYKRRRGLL